MTEGFFIDLAQKGGLTGIAVGALWLAYYIFTKYLELNAALLLLVKEDARSDQELITEMRSLIEAVKGNERRGRR